MSTTSQTVEHAVRPARRIDRSILFGSVAILGLGQSLMFIIMGPLARDVGLSEIQYGMIFSVANLGLVFAAPFWGRQCDTWGRKPVLIIGLSGCAVGYVLLAMAMQIGLWGWFSAWPLFFILLGARAVYAMTATSIYAASAAYIADTTDRAGRAQGMALIGGANSAGITVGPAVGGILALITILFPLYFAALVAAAGALIAYFVLREPERHEHDGGGIKLKFTDKRILPYLILWFGFFLGFTMLNFVTAFFIEDRFGFTETRDVIRIASLAMFCMGITEVVVQTVILQMIRIPQKVSLRLCLPFFAFGLLLLASTNSLVVLFIAYGFLGLGFSMANPGISGGASLSVAPYEQGAAAGLTSSASTIGIIIGPILGTSLYKIAPTAPMLASACFLLLLSIYAFFIKTPPTIIEQGQAN